MNLFAEPFVFPKDELDDALFCAKDAAMGGSSIVIETDDRLFVLTPSPVLPSGVDVDLGMFEGRYHHADRRVIAAFHWGQPVYYTTSFDVAREYAQRRSRETRLHVVVFVLEQIVWWLPDGSINSPDLFAVIEVDGPPFENDVSYPPFRAVRPDEIMAVYQDGQVRPHLPLELWN